jgi:prophage antirepressor-like protein
MNDKHGRKHTYVMLTEQGLYQYLLRSTLPAAEVFQEWVFDLLTTIRHEVVTAAEMTAKEARQTLDICNNNFRMMADFDQVRTML